jgi:hypothetical protein
MSLFSLLVCLLSILRYARVVTLPIKHQAFQLLQPGVFVFKSSADKSSLESRRFELTMQISHAFSQLRPQHLNAIGLSHRHYQRLIPIAI